MLLVAVQPNLIALARHFKNPDVVSPSQVLKIRINKERFDFEEIYSSSGEQLSGASVAVRYKHNLIIGSASEAKILCCKFSGVDITLNDWKRKGRFTDIKSHQIFYVLEGEGPALLLLHAYPTASWGWHKMWPELIKNSTVVAPDLLGSGFSDKPKDGNYSITNLTDIVEKLLHRLNIREIHVLAHAYGSLVAQELIARFNNSSKAGNFDKCDSKIYIRSACFINGGIFPEKAKTTLMQKFLLTPMGAAVASNFPAPYMFFKHNFSRTFGSETRPSSVEMKEFWELLTYNDGHKRVPEVIQYLNERIHKRERWVNALQKTKVPLCLIISNSDKLTGEAISEKWRDLLPDSLVIEITSPVGHYPPLEDPDQVISSYFNILTNI
jgi:pimeloyl-ACP methyl ester carboxylesterase